MLLVGYVTCIMSINVTVTANPVSVKRGKMLLTDINELKKQELNRRRKMRIEQVRQQSKDIANHIRKRVQQKTDNVLKAAEMKENSELQNYQERKLKSLQQKYHECLDEVGLAHTHAALQPDPVSVLATQIERISDQAKIRGKQALEKQKAENRKLSETENILQRQKKYLQSAEDLRSARTVAGKKTADDRTERIPLMPTAVNVQRGLPSNTVRRQPMNTVSKKVQQTSKVAEHSPKALMQLDGDSSDSSISSSHSDEELLVPCYEFQPPASARSSGKSDLMDSAADFGKVLKASYSDLRTTEQTSGRKKLPQFLELPEVLDNDDDEDDDDDGRETPDSQEKGLDQYLMSSDESSTSHIPPSSLGTYSKRPRRDQQVPPLVINSKTSCLESDPSRTSISGQKPVLQPMTSGPKSDPLRTSSTEQKSVLQPMISEQLTSSETTSHYSRPRTVPVWQSKESLRSVTSYPSSRRVHFYDYGSRYQQQCDHPQDIVQKVDEPFQKTAVQLAEEVAAASEATQKEKLKKKLHQEQLQQCRSSQALARERLKRQYNLLLSELETLSRKERLARAQNISVTAPAIHMSEARWKERGNIRQRNMDSVFERVYYHSSEPHTQDDANAVPSLQGKMTDIPSDKQKNIAVDSEVKLNVGGCIPPRTAVPGKELTPRKVTHSAAASGSKEQQTFRAASQSKKPEEVNHSQVPGLEDLTDEVKIHLEKTCSLNSKPSNAGRAGLETAATASEALSVSASFSSQTTSRSSSSDVSSDREMATSSELKILNSKHKIDVLRNESTRQTTDRNNLTSRITLFECTDTVLTTGVSQPEHKQENLKRSSEKKSQKEVPSKYPDSNSVEEQQDSEQLSRKASKCGRLKLLRSKGIESKKMEDNVDKVKLTTSSSSSSSVSGRGALEGREKSFGDPETSSTSTDPHSPYDNVKIVVKVCDKLQELKGNKLYETLDSEETNRKTEEMKHCKQHCGKKVLYRDVFTKEQQAQPGIKKLCETEENLISGGVNKSPQLGLGQKGLDFKGHMSPKTSKLTGRPYRDNQMGRSKLHNESDGTYDSDHDNNEEEQDGVSKELDETMNAMSASTSYFSPPEKMSTARAKEIESAVDAISSFELNTEKCDLTVLDTQTSFNPQLNCYIRRLLAMSRESVENLSVSISDISIQAEEIITCSTRQPLNSDELNKSNCRRAWISILSDRHADKQEILQQGALDIKEGTGQTIDSCDTDVKMSNQANSTAVCESNCNNMLFSASGATELTDVLSEENRDSNTVDLQGKIKNAEGKPTLECEKVTPGDDGSVIEVNHSDLIVAMNKRIVSAINEMSSTVPSLPLESNVLGLKRIFTNACKQTAHPVAELEVATDIPSPQTDLRELAEKYSKRVSDLSKKLEHLRLEKQHILEMSSSGSGSDREVCDTTAYSSPPLKVNIVPDVKHYQPEDVQLQVAPPGSNVLTSQEHNGTVHSFRGKPPVSLSQKLIRDTCTPHELSTIIEVDSLQVPQTQEDTAAEVVTSPTEEKVIDSNPQTSAPEVSVVKDKNISALEDEHSSASDKNLSASGGDVLREIMAELLQRKLLTSPYHWLKDEYEQKLVEDGSSVAEAALSNENSERENLDTKASKENLNNYSITDTTEQTSFQTSSKSENSNVEEIYPPAHSSNIHQIDLHSMLEKLGIGWASSMLRKTRQAMTYSSSSSENSHDFSASLRKNSFKDAKYSKEENQALNCENGKSTMRPNLPQYKKKQFVCATFSSKDTPMQGSASPGNSITSDISETRDTEISTARDESCDDEHLRIKVPNISLTRKLKVSINGSNRLS